MKKLSLGLVVCALASVAYGVPAFVVNGGAPIELTPGVPVTVDVTITGAAGGIGGMTLNLETSPNNLNPDDPFSADGPFQIEGLVIDAAGSGTMFAGNTTGASLLGKWDGSAPGIMAQGSVTTATGTLANAAGIAGKVTIMAKLGTEGMQGLLTTAASFLGDSAMFSAAGESLGFAQGSAPLMVIPEPVSGLLLLAGLPLLRRRRA